MCTFFTPIFFFLFFSFRQAWGRPEVSTTRTGGCFGALTWHNLKADQAAGRATSAAYDMA